MGTFGQHWTTVNKKRRPREERFWESVAKSPGCWEWSKSRNERGYGRFVTRNYYKTTTERAHRVSWELTYGPIPDGMCILHKCDNPPCVRPDHLFLGTRIDNNIDRDRKGRWVNHYKETT